MIDFYPHEEIAEQIAEADEEHDTEAIALYLSAIAKLLYNKAREDD